MVINFTGRDQSNLMFPITKLNPVV